LKNKVKKMVKVVILKGAAALTSDRFQLMEEIQARRLERNGKVKILYATQKHPGPTYRKFTVGG